MWDTWKNEKMISEWLKLLQVDCIIFTAQEEEDAISNFFLFFFFLFPIYIITYAMKVMFLPVWAW